MPYGKPAGIPCVQLLPDYSCALFGMPERPAVCLSLRPTESMCGANRAEAIRTLASLELMTALNQPDAALTDDEQGLRGAERLMIREALPPADLCSSESTMRRGTEPLPCAQHRNEK